jgi:chromosomal replication initiator protein
VPLATAYSATQIWDSTLSQLLLRVTRQNYETWLRNTAGLRFDGTVLVVGAPNDLARDWLASRMRTVIMQALTAAAGPGLQVSFEVIETETTAEASPLQPPLISSLAPPLNPRFTFPAFLRSSFNQLAYSAARGIATEEHTCYSPLFITGPSGSGKTHLLHAIGHDAVKQRKQFVLVGAEQFLNEYTTAVRTHSGATFRARYHDVDLLMVDDVHLLLGKRATTAEFYRTVAALHDEGRLVAVAGDLALMNGDGARFESELRWGLVATIEAPNAEERVRFIELKASGQGIEMPEEVMHYIALRVRSTVRELEGAVNRVAALARISQEPITIDFAAKALRPLRDAAAGQAAVQPTDLFEAVCRHLELSPADVRGASRQRAVTYARHIAMYLLRCDGGLTYKAIAQLLDKKDHSTVVHACNAIENELAISPPLRADIDSIRASLRQLDQAI